MEKQLYTEMYHKEKDNWWFKGKRLAIHALISKYIPQHTSVLDIGCGTGIILKEFQSKGKDVYGTDISNEAIQFAQKRGLTNIFNIDFSKEPIPQKYFDLILCLDVLEHIENDKAALLNITKNMQADSHLLLTVPAFPLLWGADDIVLHHKRRYTKKQLTELFNACGLRIIKSSYSNFFIFPLVFALRWLDKLRPNHRPESTIKMAPKFINEIALLFYKFEAWFLKRFNFPFGSSIICLAKKN